MRYLWIAILLAGCIRGGDTVVTNGGSVIIFDPIAVPVPLGTVLTASNVDEDDAAVWSATPSNFTWTIRTSAANNNWRSVAYGNGLFVAVSVSGDGNRVMTSPDGITWTARTSAADNQWNSVTYGNGLFVAVAGSGTGNRVMTSPDGITWTIRTSAADNDWYAVTFGNGLFVAVAFTGTANRVMTSPDGITWTIRTSAADNNWGAVTYGGALFVAVAGTGTGNRVMTSPDGITWTIRTSAGDLSWQAVVYGNGVFVAVSLGGGGANSVMTSPDGTTWTIRTSAADNQWWGVAYGAGLFVAVASTGTGNRVQTSPDGITWTIRTSAADNQWRSVTFGSGLFVAVAASGTGNRVMTNNPYYDIGNQVIYTPDKHLYEVLANSTSDNPAEGALLTPPTWLDLGPINRWKMFDTYVTLQTERAANIEVTIDPGTDINAVALLNVTATSVRVTRTGYDSGTVALAGRTDIVFLMPTATGDNITILVTAATGNAKIGEALLGLQQELGLTNFGTSIGITDYSRKETDDFGNLVVVERRFSKWADFDVTVDTVDVASVQRELAAVRATPVVYIGDSDREETIIYGFYKNFTIVLSNSAISSCSLRIDGLT